MLGWFEKHNKISWVITILTAIFIFYMSSKVFEASSYAVTWISVVYHISVFTLLSFFLFLALGNEKRRPIVFILGFTLAILYGVLDELHQYFVLGRTCTIVDVGFDSLGVLLASFFYFIWIKVPKLNTKL